MGVQLVRVPYVKAGHVSLATYARPGVLNRANMVAAGSGTASCSIAAVDPTLEVRGVYTGSVDATYVIEVLEDDTIPNTYRWKKNGGAWTTAAMQNVFHPSGGFGGEGANIRFVATVGHTTGQWWSFTASSSNDTVSTATLQSTHREWELCSNRGVCDEDKGTCKCFDNWGTWAW